MRRVVKFRVQCMECGRKWLTSNTMPECSRCGSVDIELAEED